MKSGSANVVTVVTVVSAFIVRFRQPYNSYSYSVSLGLPITLLPHTMVKAEINLAIISRYRHTIHAIQLQKLKYNWFIKLS